MAVEHLIRPTITNIDNLQPVEKKPESGALRLYRQLLEGPLRNSKYTSGLTDAGFANMTDTQLSMIYTDILFEKEKAVNDYNSLKQSGFYDSERQKWNPSYKIFETVNYEGGSFHQLLGVLIEGMIDKNTAKVTYQGLKQSALYDAEKEEWLLGENDSRRRFNRYAGDQLLGVLVEGMFDKNRAKKRFEQLKQTRWYDSNHDQWLMSNMESDGDDTRRLARDQLLAVLVVGMFDIEQAKDSYKQLQKTELYDEEGQIWLASIAEDQTILSPYISRVDQLLGVCIERMFEERDGIDQQEQAVPVVRRF